MAIADIVSITGTIESSGGVAGNVTAFDGSTFLATIKQDSDFVAYADALTGQNMVGIYLLWSGQSEWEATIYFPDSQHSTYVISTDSVPHTLAQLGITANVVNAGFDAITLTVEYPEYEFPDMFYNMSPYNTGIVTAFDVDTFVDALNQDTNLTDYYRNSGSPTLVGLEIHSGGDGTWEISFHNSNGTWYDEWYDESDSYTLAQLGITADLTKSGYDMVYLAPDDGYTLPPMLGAIAEAGDQIVAAFDADTFITTMSRDAYVVDLVRYFGNNFSSIFFGNYGGGEWDSEIAFDNDQGYYLNDLNSPYTLAQLGITTDLSEEGADLIYLLKKKAGVTSAKAYGPVSGVSKRIHKLYSSVNGESVEIKKLYGSVNGESRLIYKAMPYYPATAYGVVYYKPDANGSTVCSVILQSQAEFDSLCNLSYGRSPWAAILGNGSVMVTSYDTTNVIVGVDIGQNITQIRPGFLQGCTMLNRALTIPNNVTAIGSYFLQDCTGFNQSITLSSNLTSIGSEFLSGCTSFNQPLSLPSSLTSSNSIGDKFMYKCNNMVSEVNIGSLNANIASSSNYTFATNYSSVACYATGIPIAGANRAAWLSRFPNRTSVPYRKLVDAGY